LSTAGQRGVDDLPDDDGRDLDRLPSLSLT
jgi:hypothetical protein